MEWIEPEKKTQKYLNWLHVAGSATSVTAFVLLILDRTIGSLNIVKILILLMFTLLGLSILASVLYALNKIRNDLAKYDTIIQLIYFSLLLGMILFLIIIFAPIVIILSKTFLHDVPTWYNYT